jgi:hypothetical protein
VPNVSYKVVLKDQDEVTLQTIDSIQGSLNDAISDDSLVEAKLASSLANLIPQVVSTRLALKAIDTSRYKVAHLIEDGREGIFELVAYASYSTVVTADTAEAVAIQSTDDPTKAWLRRDHAQINVMWAGASRAASEATNLGALENAIEIVNALGYGGVFVPSGINYGYDLEDPDTHPNRIAKALGVSVGFTTIDYGTGSTYTAPSKDGTQVRYFPYTVQTSPAGLHDGNSFWWAGDWNPSFILNVNQDYAAPSDPSRTADDNLRASLFWAHSGVVAWGMQTGGVTGSTYTTDEMLRFNMNVIGVPDLGLTDQTAVWTVQKTDLSVNWYTNDWILQFRTNGLAKLFELTTSEATNLLCVWENLNNSAQWMVGTGTSSTDDAMTLAINASTKLKFLRNGDVRPGADNSQAFGSVDARWSTIYAGTGTINTSDGDDKDKVAAAFDDAAAIRAARRIDLVRFQWRDAILEKGVDGARLHFGVIAQQVKEAFEAEGLDAFRYGLLCFNEWEDQFDEVQEQAKDAGGNLLWDEQDNGARLPRVSVRRELRTAAGSRYGVRYDELWALMIAAERQRNDTMEARLAALEAN